LVAATIRASAGTGASAPYLAADDGPHDVRALERRADAAVAADEGARARIEDVLLPQVPATHGVELLGVEATNSYHPSPRPEELAVRAVHGLGCRPQADRPEAAAVDAGTVGDLRVVHIAEIDDGIPEALDEVANAIEVVPADFHYLVLRPCSAELRHGLPDSLTCHLDLEVDALQRLRQV
jgi:hypothetical protein